jgi:molecular chaperone DnaJ
MDHYARLGVAEDATTEQVRDAYRRAARRHHPDAPGGDARTMAAVNEAWRVLGDPGTRLDYDRQRRAERRSAAEPSAAAGTTREDELRAWQPPPPTVGPAKVPWRLLTGMAVVGIVIVLIGVVTYQPPTPLGPDNLLQSGSCVDIDATGAAVEVLCTGPHQGVVEQLIPFDGVCQAPAVAHRDRQGMGIACVRFDLATGG